MDQPPRCPNPYCDGTGWITAGATATSNAYRVWACKVGPHPLDRSKRLAVRYTLLALAILCLPLMGLATGGAFAAILAGGLVLVGIAVWVRPRDF